MSDAKSELPLIRKGDVFLIEAYYDAQKREVRRTHSISMSSYGVVEIPPDPRINGPVRVTVRLRDGHADEGCLCDYEYEAKTQTWRETNDDRGFGYAILSPNAFCSAAIPSDPFPVAEDKKVDELKLADRVWLYRQHEYPDGSYSYFRFGAEFRVTSPLQNDKLLVQADTMTVTLRTLSGGEAGKMCLSHCKIGDQTVLGIDDKTQMVHLQTRVTWSGLPPEVLTATERIVVKFEAR